MRKAKQLCGPSTRPDDAETQATADFVSNEGPKMHGAFGGAPQYSPDTGHFQNPTPYKSLALALQDYVPLNGLTQGVEIGPNATESTWNALFDKTNQADDRANGAEKSPLAIFRKMWLKIGENTEFIDPWIELIPDAYGLAVVKVSIAIILKVAQHAADKRQKIFDALTDLRNLIGEASSRRKSFHTDPDVSKCAAQLYEGIVEAIQEILELLPAPREPFQWRRLIKLGKDKDKDKEKGKEKEKKKKTKDETDPVKILGRVQDLAKELVFAVERRRDNTIEDTGKLAQDTNKQLSIVMGWIVTEADVNIKETKRLVADTKDIAVENRTIAGQTKIMIGGIELQIEDMAIDLRTGADLMQQGIREQQELKRMITDQKSTAVSMEDTLNFLKDGFQKFMATSSEEKRSRNRGIMNDRETTNDKMLELLEERRKNAALRRQIREMKRQEGANRQPKVQKLIMSRATITLERLYEILCLPLSSADTPPPAEDSTPPLEATLEGLEQDLAQIAKWRGRIDQGAQGQAQTLFHHARFHGWIKTLHPDLLLVDGNIPSAARQTVSAMSLFCANFVLSMSELEPDAIMTYFFCGLHAWPKDPFAGPTGLLRSVIVQLIAALDDEDQLSLEFLVRSYVRDLEDHDIGRLCDLLHVIALQFLPTKTVYCIIDGIAVLDTSESFEGLARVLAALEGVVDDDDLRPRFKVLMTLPGKSTLRVQRALGDSDRHLTLSGRAANPKQLSGRLLTAEITRPARPWSRQGSRGPSPARPVSRGRRGGSRSGYEDEDEDDDDDQDVSDSD
ncbi:hypothetical protein B0T19DRAFT_416517 [Cercophora scortea]|uniref:Uncharacterized protein n=1 Tax=Cercophora scortea TaxID=314031 RepID=A0AAE0IX16_9PEZI|nr:hypothetical protein B0T19DRAFT_416517 [Cercophora scortea]